MGAPLAAPLVLQTRGPRVLAPLELGPMLRVLLGGPWGHHGVLLGGSRSTHRVLLWSSGGSHGVLLGGARVLDRGPNCPGGSGVVLAGAPVLGLVLGPPTVLGPPAPGVGEEALGPRQPGAAGVITGAGAAVS